MITFTNAQTVLGRLTGDSSSGNLEIMNLLHNEAIRECITTKPWGFRQKTRTSSTLTSNVHQMAPDCGKLLTVTVTEGSTKYTPCRAKDREHWDMLTQSTNTTSNIPEYWFPFGKTYSFYPAPSSAGTNNITESYEREHRDLSIPDYTTGTITSITSGSTTVTGASTVWTSQMAGRYIRITNSDTTNTGDGFWYEIASVTNATTLVLVAPYQGNSISAGTASYIIGQTSMIPEDHQLTPIYRAVMSYFKYIQPDSNRAELAADDFDRGMRRMQVECGSMAVL